MGEVRGERGENTMKQPWEDTCQTKRKEKQNKIRKEPPIRNSTVQGSTTHKLRLGRKEWNLMTRGRPNGLTGASNATMDRGALETEPERCREKYVILGIDKENRDI